MFDIKPEGFITRLEATLERPLSDFEHKLLQISLEVERPTEIKYRQEDGEDIRGLYTEYIPLEHAAERYAQGRIGRWLYDRRLKLWFINMNSGAHVQLMATLYRLYENQPYGDSDAMADEYIDKHCGFFVSGALNLYLPVKADDCVLTPDEAIFEQARGRHVWRGING